MGLVGGLELQLLLVCGMVGVIGLQACWVGHKCSAATGMEGEILHSLINLEAE